MLIAFTGFKGTGKSTAARHLINAFGFIPHNFKDALVRELKQNFPDLLLQFANHYYQEPDGVDYLFFDKPPMMRALLQNYGTEVRRGDRDDYWVNQWREAYNPDRHTVVDDVRFYNEARAVIEMGGIIIQLARPDVTDGGNHQSECEFLTIPTAYKIVSEPGDVEAVYSRLNQIVDIEVLK